MVEVSSHCILTLTWSFIYIAAFVLTPTSVNATLGTTATFNCSSTTGSIVWLVTGSSSVNRSDITSSSIGSLSSLHVLATEDYNNTNMTCIVFFFVGIKPEHLISDPAVLRVQGMFGMWTCIPGVSSRNCHVCNMLVPRKWSTMGEIYFCE